MDKNRLKNYLNDKFEIYPDSTELEDIIRIAVDQDSYEANKGYRFERTKDNPREEAFYKQWLEENDPCRGINYGNGILQDLFIEEIPNQLFGRRYIIEINNRDRMIVATIIQWLGSNVGMGFLYGALGRFGATITYNNMNKTKTAEK